jgi:hypothetical protein
MNYWPLVPNLSKCGHDRECVKKMREKNLTMKPVKYKFDYTKIKILVHEVSAEGIRFDKDKGATIFKTAASSTVKLLQTFWGACS